MLKFGNSIQFAALHTMQMAALTLDVQYDTLTYIRSHLDEKYIESLAGFSLCKKNQ